MAIAVDSAGAAYVTGFTESGGFPTTTDAFQTANRQGTDDPLIPAGDAFIAKLNPAGSDLVYSTFLGGSKNDVGTSIAVDGGGYAYVAGITTSTAFPVTANAAQPKYGGTLGQNDTTTGDAFVAKVNPSGTAMVYSTYLGGQRDDAAFGIAVDSSGNAYVVGNAASTDFPTTAQSYQPVHKGTGGSRWVAAGDAFVTKLNATGSIVFSTYLGGTADDRATSVALAANGDVWVVGHTVSDNFPVTSDAIQKLYKGSPATEEFFRTGDAFLARLSADGRSLPFSS